MADAAGMDPDAWERTLAQASALLRSVVEPEADEPGGISRVLDPAAVRVVEDLAGLLVGRDASEDPYTGAYLVLGMLRWFRYRALPKGQDLDAFVAALETFQLIFLTAPDPFHMTVIAVLPGLAVISEQLITTMWTQPRDSPDPGLPDRVLRLWQRIVDASPADDPERAGYLTRLALVRQLRYERSGEWADLAAAVDAAGQAAEGAEPDHPDRATALSILGAGLQTRFAHTGDRADLNRAIDVGHQAVQAAAGQFAPLATLAGALELRFNVAGDLADLDAAIAAQRQALDAGPDTGPARAQMLSSLSVLLKKRFGRSGALPELAQAAAAASEAVDLTVAGSNPYALYQSNLGDVLRIRFERFGTAPTWTPRSRRDDKRSKPHTRAIPTCPATWSASPTRCSGGSSEARTRRTWTRRSPPAGRRPNPSPPAPPTTACI